MKEKKRSKGFKLLDGVMLLLLFVGLGVLAYPFVQDRLNDFLDQQIISQYQQKANQENEQAMKRIKAEMEAKNQVLAEKGNNPGVDSFNQAVSDSEAGTIPATKQKDYYETHTIGVIHIPKIKVSLPIFDETNDLFLQKGTSLLEGTSFPVGGDSTHSVLSAHRGLPEATLFTDLPKLVVGDKFFIEINNETHAYQVNDIRVVEPTDTEHLLIEKGQDLVTLLTCTPYMINTHRLLVTGHRVPYVPEKDTQEIREISDWKKSLFIAWLAGAFLLLLLLIYFIWHWRRAALIGRKRVDLQVQILDAETKQPLSGVVYKLMTKNGKKAVFRENQPIRLISDAEGLIQLEKVKGGTYTLVDDQNQELIQQASVLLTIKKITDQQFTLVFPQRKVVEPQPQETTVPQILRQKK